MVQTLGGFAVDESVDRRDAHERHRSEHKSAVS
jgi:hypothetical protein